MYTILLMSVDIDFSKCDVHQKEPELSVNLRPSSDDDQLMLLSRPVLPTGGRHYTAKTDILLKNFTKDSMKFFN